MSGLDGTVSAPVPADRDRQAWQDEYIQALNDYFAGGGERALGRASELGRSAFGHGVSLLDVIMLHQGALDRALIRSSDRRAERLKSRRAAEFLIESLWPFEMAHRAFFETNLALRELNQALEGEAKRIARLLHDGAGQMLFALELAIGDLARSGTPGSLMAEISRLTFRLDQQIRCLSHELHPVALEDSGLVAALELLASRITKQTGLRIVMNTSLSGRLPEEIEACLYRSIHEALTNSLKHADATEVTVNLAQADDVVSCAIRDDGVGPPASNISADNRDGVGLAGMRARLRELRGSLHVHALAGSGTEVIISVPVPA